MAFPEKISKEEILKYPIVKFEGDIILIDNINQYNKHFDNLLKSNKWGFDTETKPSFKKGKSNINKVSLIQLSSEDTTYLFRINKIGLPDSLVDFLANPDYIKIGLSIKDDLSGLAKIKYFEPKGFIDLQSIVSNYGIEETGLRKLAAIVLQKRVSKTQQLTNWEAEELNIKQLIYAATDSWVCQKIYKALLNESKRTGN